MYCKCVILPVRKQELHADISHMNTCLTVVLLKKYIAIQIKLWSNFMYPNSTNILHYFQTQKSSLPLESSINSPSFNPAYAHHGPFKWIIMKKKALIFNILTPGPPTPGSEGPHYVFPKSPVKGYFSCDKVRPENCKKGGYLTFHPEISFKKGWFLFLSLEISLWTPEKFIKGVIK